MKYTKHKGKIYKIMYKDELTYDVLPYKQPNEKYDPTKSDWFNISECENLNFKDRLKVFFTICKL